MRAPLEWLHEYCRPDLSAQELAERLDMTGTKVERIERHGVGAAEAFVVGRVVSAERHPDADRLSVCRVDVGDREASIVCGAPNVAAGQTVAVARPGAVMPDGTELRAAKLRGVVSEGMILAEDELGIGTDHSGIIVLDDGPAPGTPLDEVLPIATEVLELEITPNRPDCLGVYGVAREVHAATGAPLAAPPWAQDPGTPGEVPGVEVAVETDLCPRFTARRFEEVRIGPSPIWLKARLTAAGQRPINNVVDITNYVMLLTGQPLHAFDMDRVAGARLVVRQAREGEQVETLDGEVRTLDPEVVVIEDADGPTSIAGVMGGARSEVSESTTRVLMEAATWVGPNIQRTSLRLGLRSEASARFEKQLQPEQAMEAQAVAAALMVQLAGARLVEGTIDVGQPAPEPEVLPLRESRVGSLLGKRISGDRSEEILHSLGFLVAVDPDAASPGSVAADAELAAGLPSDAGVDLSVTVPHWRRGDVEREVDLIEEVARIDGVDRLPATLPARPDRGGLLTAQQRARRHAEDALTAQGLYEVQGWSFQGPSVADRLRLPDEDRRRRAVRVRNPLSEEQSVLRTTLLGSLLDAAAHNVARDRPDLRLFETGGVYLDAPGQPLPDERRHLGALLTGALAGPSWRAPAPPRADFFAAKGVLAALLDALRVPWSVQAEREPFLHPGRSATVLLDGEPAGWLGEVHPLVASAWDLDGAAGFELDLDRVTGLAAARESAYRDLTSFPPVRQDLAVVVPDEVTAARVEEVVRAAGGELLRGARVFDVYRGEQVGEGRVSLALALEFQAPDRTLTDEEVAKLRDAIATALADGVGGELRG
ncbi:MAG: phenylalanyl-tRNA synthetase beta chain [Solirubrobacteraceae bacterium]|jgi:phenylalanyl-tRNA synthetase beta chain|nr:phenylalanyl-tRNA synthetase beta chain [Solirubrobacteraceae bacterium]